MLNSLAWGNGDEGSQSENGSSTYSDEYESESECNDGIGIGGEGTGLDPESMSPVTPGVHPRKNSVGLSSSGGGGSGGGGGGYGADDGTSSTASTLSVLTSPGFVGTSLRLRSESNGGSWRSSNMKRSSGRSMGDGASIMRDNLGASRRVSYLSVGAGPSGKTSARVRPEES